MNTTTQSRPLSYCKRFLFIFLLGMAFFVAYFIIPFDFLLWAGIFFFAISSWFGILALFTSLNKVCDDL